VIIPTTRGRTEAQGASFLNIGFIENTCILNRIVTETGWFRVVVARRLAVCKISRVGRELERGDKDSPRASVIGSDQVHYTTKKMGGEGTVRSIKTYTNEGKED